MSVRDPHPPILTRTGSVDLNRRRIRRDGSEIPLSRLEAALLAYLAERPNQEISREELLREIWQREVARSSRAVDFTMRRLRQKLGEPDPPEQLLTAHGVGYRFVPYDPEPARTSPVTAGPRTLVCTAHGVIDLDRHAFERADGVIVPLSRLDGAVLRRLAAAPGHPVALDTLARELWGRGHHRQSVSTAIARLRKKLEADPARPAVLVTTPGSGVRLEGQLAVRADRTNLSPLGSSFVPSVDMAELLDLVARHPLVTLRGTGGIGKTRLARQLGSLYLSRDPRIELWFCDLASVSEEHDIAEALARELGFELTGPDLAERLGRVLAGRPAGSVLILDNFEHLVAFGSIVSDWRAAAPGIRIWITSRIALDLPEERCVDVAPLDDASALRLFGDRSSGAVTGDDPAIRALVRRLDGLPLAIELAAARAHQMTPDDLLARIGERLDLLVRPARDSTSHHPTLRGAFDWSWDLLDADERKALATMSVLVSPFDTATAGALIDGGEALLKKLVAHSLVHQEGTDRWRLFEAIREYAFEKLVLSGDRDRSLVRRATLFLDRAEPWVAALSGPEAGVPHRRLREHRDELVAVYQTSPDVDTAARAALVLAAVEESTGYTPVLERLLEDAVLRSPGAPLLWQLLWRLSLSSRRIEDEGRARVYLDRALAIALDQSALAATIVRRQIALDESVLGNDAEAARGLADARAAFLSLGEPGWAARTLGNLAWIELRGPEPSLALERMAMAVRELRNVGEHRHLAALLIRRSEGLQVVGRLDESSVCLHEALALARAGDHLDTHRRALQALAALDLERGNFEAAVRQYHELERLFREAGSPAEEQLARNSRATVALERGDIARAEQLMKKIDLTHASFGNRLLYRVNRSVLWLLRGQAALARADLSSMRVERDVHHRYWIHVNGYLAVALALEGSLPEAEQRLVDVGTTFDRNLVGVERFVALCRATVDWAHVRDVDPEGAARKAKTALAAGTLVSNDEGFPIERPQDVNLLRQLLLRLALPDGAGFDTRAYHR